jgi:hypothetical protein
MRADVATEGRTEKCVKDISRLQHLFAKAPKNFILMDKITNEGC